MGRNKIKNNKAVFLDRDGVINKNIFYDDTNEWESPRDILDFNIYKDAINSLKILQENNYQLFIVTNQPSYAKGKTSLEKLNKIIDHANNIFKDNSVKIQKTYCSFKHKDSIYKDYKTPCNYRKPNIGALLDAEMNFNIDLKKSWMVGDRETDIQCGKKAGTKTIKINLNNDSYSNEADFNVNDIEEACEIIISKN